MLPEVWLSSQSEISVRIADPTTAGMDGERGGVTYEINKHAKFLQEWNMKLR